jgi:hypothetical protein
MTTTSPTRREMRTATSLALREMLRVARPLWWIGGVLALLGLVAAPVAGIVTSTTDSYLLGHASRWELAGTPVLWILFVTGILVTPALLPLLVAHGLTRRSVALAGTVAGAIVAASAGLYMAAGFLVERAWHGAAGFSHEVTRGHLFDSAFQVHLVFAQYALAGAVFLASGWLVGSAYYRLGGWRGTLLLPVTAGLPLLATEFLLTSRERMWTAWEPVARDGSGAVGDTGTPVALTPWLAVLLGVAVLVACLLAVRALTRTIPLRTVVKP